MTGLRVAVARWEDIPGERLENYRRCLREAGLQPVDCSRPDEMFDGCSGLLLTGGIDVDPKLYGELAWPQVEATNRQRDLFEMRLLYDALAHDLPVLAVCRGHQLLNVALGGRLLQHIEGDYHDSLDDERMTSQSHPVVLERGSRLALSYNSERIIVNSRHHQAVLRDGVAKGLRVAAVSPDGLIEGLESEEHTWVVGVQWHPERADAYLEGFAEQSMRLWTAFAEAVKQAQD